MLHDDPVFAITANDRAGVGGAEDARGSQATFLRFLDLLSRDTNRETLETAPLKLAPRLLRAQSPKTACPDHGRHRCPAAAGAWCKGGVRVQLQTDITLARVTGDRRLATNTKRFSCVKPCLRQPQPSPPHPPIVLPKPRLKEIAQKQRRVQLRITVQHGSEAWWHRVTNAAVGIATTASSPPGCPTAPEWLTLTTRRLGQPP